jgi:glycogen operon protein
MLEMGDELWRTQHGNNNPYCHDSELTWLDWDVTSDGQTMLTFARTLSALRKRHANLRRRRFLRGVAPPVSRGKDVMWLRLDGSEMGPKDWIDPARAALAFRLDGDAIEHTPESGVVSDDSLIVMMNAELEPTTFRLPRALFGAEWRVVLETNETPRIGLAIRAGETIDLGPGCLVVVVEIGRNVT